MSGPSDFASMMESLGEQQATRTNRRLRPGAVVEGRVVQIGKDAIFVDVGATVEARIDRGELEDKKGNLGVRVGDTLRASVVSNSDVSGPVLSVALGKGPSGALDVSALEAAKAGGLPVEGSVAGITKGGVTVQIAGVRGFCPASQLDSGYIKELEPWVGQTHQFLILEVKDNGRSVIVSRRALLEKLKAEQSKEFLERLQVGGEYEGTITTVQKYGAFVELEGGVEGLIHVSELAHGRTDRVEDVVNVGEKVRVKVLAIEPSEKEARPKLRLSIKALEQAPQTDQPEPGRVLTGTVSKVTSFGVFIDTEKGSGLVPGREMGLHRGADFRRAFPIGTEVKVVFLSRDDAGRMSFSMARVAGVEERQNFRDFTRAAKPGEQQPALGTFGMLLKEKLQLPDPAVPPTATPASEAASSEQPVAKQAEAPAPRPSATPAPEPKRGPPPHEDPAGLIRRKR